MREPIIELDRVVKRFAVGEQTVTALDHLSLRLEAGRISGLVGPDGAGKTTLMRLVTGLLTPDSGTIRVLGMDSVKEAQAVQSTIGYMPQRFGLYEDLSVQENLNLYADLQGLEGRQRAARFAQLMDFTGLGPFRTRLAGRLSGGMKQKLGLACMLVRPPKLLLLDEPSVGVDPISRRELWSMVNKLIDDGISVLWSTAYLNEAELCHDVYLLSEGRLLGSGPPNTFNASLKDRTFVLPAKGLSKRDMLNAMRTAPNVMDAVIKGQDVRVLLSRPAQAEDLHRLASLADIPAERIRPVPPVFEDAFISLLKARQKKDGFSAPPSAAGMPLRQPAKRKGKAPIPAQEAVIEVENLVRTFGAFRAVDGLDFRVRRGEIFGLLGPNGAGKSTTFKMLCGLLPPSQGKALVLGIDLRRAAPLARGHIGYMAQKFSLYGNMTVKQNLRFFASAYGLTKGTKERRIDEELEEFDLRPYADTNSEDLPLGYQQRLALACAIMHRPAIVFLDEPTSGVDPLVRREFWRRINAMAEAGVTIMVTTHFMEEAEYCDRIAIIYQGKLIAMGSPDEIKSRHKTSLRPDPTLEDAFIDLIERSDHRAAS